ncbi:MAG TPA: class I SAM-dependent methyltransferase [Nocardioides sp.]|nr:class I SAM-dependent methyltransferase [Nocardioides sp.]
MANFQVPADAYERFMGVFSTPLALQFADLGLEGVRADAKVVDVGCGPGMLTAELVRRFGEANVSAIDPVAPFVEANAARHPGADIRQGTAEDLPFPDQTYDAALAQLVVHFMDAPVAGLAEMARVVVPGGRVSACVWDHAGDRGPLTPVWRAAHRVDPDVQDEADLAGASAGSLTELFTRAGLREVEETSLTVAVEFATFEEWWTPYTYGVGTAGAYAMGLDEEVRARLVAALREDLGDGPFTIEGSAWAATGLV